MTSASSGEDLSVGGNAASSDVKNKPGGFYYKEFQLSDSGVEQFLHDLEEKGEFVYNKGHRLYKATTAKRNFFMCCEDKLKFGRLTGDSARKLYERIRADLRKESKPVHVSGVNRPVRGNYPFMESGQFMLAHTRHTEWKSRMPSCATKDDMKRRWLAVMRVTQRTYSPNDRVPYDSLATLGQFGITRNMLVDMFSNFKKHGKSRSHDEAKEEYINHKTSLSLSVVDGISTSSNRGTNDVKNKGVSSNCKCCESSSSSGDQAGLYRVCAMEHIQLGTRVDIKRSDGRIHDAFVYEKFNCGATVRWFECEAGACVAKMKKISVEDLILLIPELTEKAVGIKHVKC